MKTTKQLGIWMDHSIAHIMEFQNGSMTTQSIQSLSKLAREPQSYKDEKFMLNREKNQLSIFFQKLSDVIINYDEVVLFGPTRAKNELINTLKENHLFEKIKIENRPADKMTESQRVDFVRDHFNSKIS